MTLASNGSTFTWQPAAFPPLPIPGNATLETLIIEPILEAELSILNDQLRSFAQKMGLEIDPAYKAAYKLKTPLGNARVDPDNLVVFDGLGQQLRVNLDYSLQQGWLLFAEVPVLDAEVAYQTVTDVAPYHPITLQSQWPGQPYQITYGTGTQQPWLSVTSTGNTVNEYVSARTTAPGSSIVSVD
jgi:hypothetical protein